MSQRQPVTSTASPRGTQRYAVKLEWLPVENQDKEHVGAAGSDEIAPIRRDEAGEAGEAASEDKSPNQPIEIIGEDYSSPADKGSIQEELPCGGGEPEPPIKCDSCGGLFYRSSDQEASQKEEEIFPAEARLCSHCRHAQDQQIQLKNCLAELGPRYGGEIVSEELPFVSLWEAAESWRNGPARGSVTASGNSRVDRLFMTCQKKVAMCSDDQIRDMLDIAEDCWNLTVLRETLIERVSFCPNNDFGITRKEDLEAIHLLRLCGSAAGTRWHPEQVVEWYGPLNLRPPPAAAGRRRSSVVSFVSPEDMRTGRVVTLEMICREYELALQNSWNRILRILEDHIVHTDLAPKIWVVALYLDLKSVQEKCVEEMHSRGPDYYLRLEEENVLPQVLVSKLMEALQQSIRRASVCSVFSRSSCAAVMGADKDAWQDDMAWSDAEVNQECGGYADEDDEPDEEEGSEDDDADEENVMEYDDEYMDCDDASERARVRQAVPSVGASNPNPNPSVNKVEKSPHESTLSQQISSAAAEFVCRASISN